MKRGLAFILVLLLTGTVFPVVAASIPYTLEQKIEKQLSAGSGLKGTITFTSSGEAITLIDAGAWQLLSSILPVLGVDITYITPQGAQQGARQLGLSIKAAGNDIAQTTVHGNDEIFTLESNLLPEGLFGAADPGDILIQILRGSAANWPPLWLAAFSIMTADGEWNAVSENALSTYTAKLGVWLQAYTSLETIHDENGQTGIRHSSVIPAQAVKAEAKQLLIDLYADDTLLSLLQTRLTAGESAAYLQKSMMPSFFTAIDALPLDADIRILRTYDMQGNIRSEELVLPLAGSAGVATLTISREAQDKPNPVTSILCEFTPVFPGNSSGSVLRLTVTQSASADSADEHIFSGMVTFTPEPPENPGFSVRSGQPADAGVNLSYNLYFAAGAETFDTANDLNTKGYEATLVVKPESDMEWNSLSLSVTASLSSGSSSRSPTSIAATLALQDLVTGSSLSADFSGRTTAPWIVPGFAETNVTRIDLMTAEQFTHWLVQTLETASARINAAILSLLPQ